MSLRELSFIFVAGSLLIASEAQFVRGDSPPASSNSSQTSRDSGVGSSLTTGLPKNPNTISMDREAIRQDRTSIRSDRSEIEANRHDIRAAEHDIQINPQNKSADQARISADQKSISGERKDLAKNQHHLRQDQQALRTAITQHRQQQQSTGSAGATHANGFFPPTNRPKPAATGFGTETHRSEHHAHHHAR